MRKSLIRKFALLLCIITIISLCGCAPANVREVQSAIDDIGEVNISSIKAIEEANMKYDALNEEEKQQVENYEILQKANKRLSEILYTEIKGLIEKSTQLEASFFAQYYDIKNLSAAKENAKNAIDNSDNNKYVSIYTELKTRVDEFNTFVENEKNSSLSVETNNGEYPFAVDSSKIYYGFCLAPYEKQSSAYPSNPCFFDSDTTDELPIFHFEVKNSVGVYSYELRQIDTKWIEVQDGLGNLKKAFVNTEIVLYDAPESWEPNNALYPLGEGACYLFYTEDNGLTLAIKDLVNNNGYILFHY